MNYEFAGGAIVCRFDPILSVQHHISNKLTSASFTPPPRKSFLQKLAELLGQAGRP